MKNNKPLEIEYKYLIRFPDLTALETQPEYKCCELLQMYLSLPENLSEGSTRCRIRSVRNSAGVKYIKTFKQKITEITRVEIESEISEEEFNLLSNYIAKGYSPIHKVRHSFKLFGFTYEVDIFPFWSDRAYLEIEVESEEVKPPIPDFITVIKDVTFDPRYRNSALAQKIITEPIK